MRLARACGSASACLVSLGLVIALAPPARSQPLALRPNPRIGYAYPAGGQQGTTFTVTIGGQYLNGVTEGIVSGRGVHVTPSTRLDQGRGSAAPGATVAVEGAGRSDGSVDADKITVVEPAGRVTTGGEAVSTPPGGAEAPAAPGAEGPAGNLVAVGSEDDVNCFAYLDQKGSKPALKINSAENMEYQENFSAGDIVYLSGGEAEGVKAGQEYFIVQPAERLRHPATNAVLGTVMRYVGHLRVLCTQDHSATAEVLASCDAVNVGAWLKPFEPIPIPMAVMPAAATRCDPASSNAKGYIVYSKDNIVSFGLDTTVLVDLGEADQVAPGSMAIVFRDNPVPGAPRILLGELAVLTTGDHWASAKIIRSFVPMKVGDRVELR
jgi:hypothetical protein